MLVCLAVIVGLLYEIHRKTVEIEKLKYEKTLTQELFAWEVARASRAKSKEILH